MSNDRVGNTISIRVPTPDGTMFVHVIEDEKAMPIEILITIGKAGASVAAWAAAMSRTCTLLLEQGLSINDLIAEFSSLTTDRVSIMKDGSNIRSGPEGIAVALTKYRTGKFRELKQQLGA